jgi:chromosome segregation ATPase
MATLAVVPPRDREAEGARRTLAEHLSGVDAIIDTIEGLDDESLDEAARNELSAMLIAELAGTRRKVDNVSAALATWESLEASASREIERLTNRRNRFARLRERLEDYTLALMEASKLPKLEGDISTFARRMNPPSVRIDDAAAVPGAFLRTPPVPAPVPDKTAIAKALKAGDAVDGCSLQQTARLVRS